MLDACQTNSIWEPISFNVPSTDLWHHLLGHHSCWWLNIRDLRCRNRVNWLRECTTWSNDWASCGSSCWYEGWWLALFAPRICLTPSCWNKGGLVKKTLCCFKRYPHSPMEGLRTINPPVWMFKWKTLYFSIMGSHTALGYAVKLDLNPEDWQYGQEE